jgi:hypothetical protein
METIQISEFLLEKLKKLRQEGGYATIERGLEHAVEQYLLELRRQKAEKNSDQIREGLAQRGHTEDEILRDFEAFRKRLRQS